MSTDKELLELAAKAAGHRFDSTNPFEIAEEHKGGTNWIEWNPLTDDADALRLAVKLNMTVKIMGDHVKVGWRGCGEQWPGEDAPVPYELPAATRRAIVRAAAEIARAE